MINESSGKDHSIFYLKEWEQIVYGNDLHQSLIEHFSYLADSPGYLELLKIIFKEAVGAFADTNKLVIEFPNNLLLESLPPKDFIKSNYPLSYKKILQKHALLSIGETIILGSDIFDPDWIDPGLLNHDSAEDVVSPIFDNQNFWVYHATEINDTGEPIIYLFSHEDSNIHEPQVINAGSLFLEKMAKALNLKPNILQAEIQTSNTELQIWWEGLDEVWKNLLNEQANVEISFSDTSQLKQILSLKSIYILKNINITSLEPLRMLKKLKSIAIHNKKIKDFTPLKTLGLLETLDLSDSSIENLEPISSINNIKFLYLENTPISSLQPLQKLTRLIHLNISNTKVSDIAIIENFKYLEELNISGTRIKSFQALSKLKELLIFNGDFTSFEYLDVLENSKRIYKISCNKTRVSLHEINRFKNLIPDDDRPLGLEIYDDFS